MKRSATAGSNEGPVTSGDYDVIHAWTTSHDSTAPVIAISPEKICCIVVKAHEFDAKDIVTNPDDGSNASGDRMIAVLEDHRDDPVAQELKGFINALTEDEQIDLAH